MLNIIAQKCKVLNIIFPTVFHSLVTLSSFPFKYFHQDFVQVRSEARDDVSISVDIFVLWLYPVSFSASLGQVWESKGSNKQTARLLVQNTFS